MAETRMVQQAYKFALDPTPHQARMFASHAGAARFAYNWGNATIIATLDARQAEKDAGGEAVTKVPSHFDLCRAWTAWKNEHAADPEPPEGERRTNTAWVSENFVGTYQAALRDAAKAWSDFFKSRSGKRQGRRLGRPKFKKRGRARDSFQVHGSTLQVTDSRHVKLPKIGVVKTHENTRKILRRLRKNQARLIRGTVSRDSDGRWLIALTVEVQRDIRTGPSQRQRQGGIIGVDFGVRDIATLSTGQAIPNPRRLEAALGKLATAQQAVARSQKGSRRRVKDVARVGRLHARVKHLRLDSLHKTTTALIHAHEVIAVEGFNVQQTAQRGSAGLPRRVRRDRNRALADTGIGIARWQLQTKGAWYGSQVLVMDPHAPTGRTCSRCGKARATPVPPAHELFDCLVSEGGCGYTAPRRLNTARALSARARQHVTVAPSTGETLNARGGDVRPGAVRRSGRSPLKREARTRPRSRGQAGGPSG